MARYKVTLTQEEQEELKMIVSKGSHKSQKVLNALILLNCDSSEGKKHTNEQISDILRVSMRKIDRVKERFVEEGMSIALGGHPKEREYKRKADGDLEAHLIALSCSEAPEGFSRWSLRMLADKAVELQYVESLSHETVRRVLKKTNLNLGKPKVG
jgi:transposase